MSTTRNALFTLAALGLAAFAAHPASAQTTITNGSFEANSFLFFPGYVNTGGNGTISGWTSNNNFSGLNPFKDGSVGNGTGPNPFANNGTDPDGGNVAFLESGNSIGSPSTNVSMTSLSQMLTGLTPGDQYQISFFANSRFQGAPSTQNPLLSLSLGGTTLFSQIIAPVGGTNPYNSETSAIYTYTGVPNGTANLVFTSTSTADATALIDGVKIQDNGPASAAPEPSQIGMLALVALGLGALAFKARKRTTASQTA